MKPATPTTRRAFTAAFQLPGGFSLSKQTRAAGRGWVPFVRDSGNRPYSMSAATAGDGRLHCHEQTTASFSPLLVRVRAERHVCAECDDKALASLGAFGTAHVQRPNYAVPHRADGRCEPASHVCTVQKLLRMCLRVALANWGQKSTTG